MNISITDNAKTELKKVIGESQLSNPALRVYIAGAG